MKRMLSLALVLLLALSLFAGCGGNNTQNNTQTGNQTTEGDGGADAGEAEREHVTIRFAQFGNNLDDAEGYENDPIRQAIEDAVNITLEYDTGTEGFDDRMETELYTGAAADLFPTWGESEKIASYIENELVVNIGEIINADPDRYPTLYKIINSDEYKMYNELYTGDPDATYAIYSISAFADPSFSGVSVYNQAILDEVNGGAVPQTVDEFLAYCEAAGSAGYVGWWPRNDKLTTWDEIDYTLAVPQGTSIQEPTVGANMKGVVLSGELGTDSEYWTVSATSEASQAVVRQLRELYLNGGLSSSIGISGDFDDAYADFGTSRIGAVNFGFGYPGQFRDFYKTAWAAANADATIDDLTVGYSLTSDGSYGPIYQTGTWVNSHYFIPYSCENPERVLDLVEFIASNEGQDLLHNCVNGGYNFDQGSDYWSEIDGAYGYGDGRCKYVWFSYMFSGTEYYVDFENQDWWTAVTYPTDFSNNWATEEDAALVDKAKETISTYVDDVIVDLPAYYNMITLPAEASEIISQLNSLTDEYLTQFIGGQLDVDSDWATYAAAYEDAGALELEQMINEAVATARSNYGG
ncbi:MAG TPA: extracellular solute-binding protein [Candidatus Pelethomonas intestinigallinarum]|nr:extracellular solute-binding protein [Candidatus Pelethomonas intestinigallinarum]